jgi:hypothetical protein
MVRPYTYSAKDTIANYTNYNQALAHPLGAGFIELIGNLRYQPMKDVYLALKGMYYTKGNDTGNANYGDNIFRSYNSRSNEYGVGMVNGIKSSCALVNFNIAYQLRSNLYIDLGATYRRYVSDLTSIPLTSSTGTSIGNISTTYVYFGIRLNAALRDYDIF